MLFNSLEFALFFPISVIGYFWLKGSYRWQWLLLCSCVFYAFFVPVYILILAATIGVDYFAAIAIEDCNNPSKKRGILILSIAVTCIILAVFKYYNFIVLNLNIANEVLGIKHQISRLDILLPIGLSFHTFQSLSYVIEVYRGNQRAERHLGIYSLYVMFFPQLVAGPIERPQNLLHQFHASKNFNYPHAVEGLQLMLYGLCKKVLIADRVSPFVDKIYSSPSAHTFSEVWLGTILFSFQIYCDFSGYSDIARGSARVLGFELMRNFDTPYFSSSISEFWRRWHISLSTWFKDYIFFPLGGSRGSIGVTIRNLLITFGISGLWHGANWTFVIWGLLNGTLLVLGVFYAKIFPNRSPSKAGRTEGLVQKWLPIGINFILINFTWVFFRAESVQKAFQVLGKMLLHYPTSLVSLLSEYRSIKNFENFGAILSILILLTLEYFLKNSDLVGGFRRQQWFLRWGCYAVVSGLLILLGRWVNASFIYFQF